MKEGVGRAHQCKNSQMDELCRWLSLSRFWSQAQSTRLSFMTLITFYGKSGE